MSALASTQIRPPETSGRGLYRDRVLATVTGALAIRRRREFLRARVASGAAGGRIEVRLDSVTGPLAGTCAGGWQTWTTSTCAVSGASGTCDLRRQRAVVPRPGRPRERAVR
ncbi:carbohydrate-binding protein [Micromonospora sp. SD12]|uniref:carbohydrate-binding protein n=1 Tax=Micromonospora sp. SD12 TaxID=3452216 RepID=UPI003F8A9651